MVIQSIGLVTDLRNQNKNISSLFIASGLAIEGDNGGGVFLWEPLNTSVDDGVNVLQVTGVATGRWVRINDSYSGVPSNRQLTINGATYDLSQNRTWNVGTVTSVNLSVPTGLTISGNPVTGSGTLAIGFASGYSISTTASQSNWDAAYLAKINSASVTGTTTKTLTLTRQDGGTITASWTDLNTGTVTSVDMSVPTGFSISGNPIVSAGTLALGFTSGYSLPTNIKQSNWDDAYTWVSNFPTQTGNAGKFLTTDGSILSWASNPLGTVTSVGLSSTTSGISIGNTPVTSSGVITIDISTASGTQNGLLSSTDWTTFNNKQNALTNPVTGTGTINYVAKFTSTGSTIGNSQIVDNGTNVLIGTTTNIQSRLQIDGTSAGGGVRIITDNSISAISIANSSSGNKLWDFSSFNNDFAINESNVDPSIILKSGGVVQLYRYATNGFLKTSSSNGTLIVDTTNYTPTSRTLTINGATYDLATDRSWSVGTVTSVSFTIGSTGTDINSSIIDSTTTPAITLNIPTASAINRGALSSADWSTFNAKQGAITLTTTGSSGAATFIGNTLNIPNYSSALTGYVPYTGATQNVDLGEYEIKAGQFTLDVSPTGTAVVGTTRWNNDIGSSETTLKGGSVVLKNGVDLVARVVNKVTPNQTLTKAQYQAVRVSGAQGQRLAVALAQGNIDINSADTIGLVTETIATNQEGFIITVGQLEEINTTGSLQGETWVDGDVLYLSPTTAGALTNVKPNGSTGHIVVIGYVEYAHAVHGKIYVKVMNGWELDELHNVYINTPINNQGLFYTSATQLWENKSIATALGYTPVNKAGDTMTGYLILNADPVSGLGAATKDYVDNLANGIDWKQSANAGTVAALPSYSVTGSGQVLTGTANGAIPSATTDGVTLVVGNRVLVKNETSTLTPNNGIYVVTQAGDGSNPFILTRSADANAPSELSEATLSISGGSTLSNTQWHCNPATTPIVIGTTNILFSQIGSGVYFGTAPISVSGNTISISQATTSTNGYLSSTDWNTFNNKQNTLSLTTSGASGSSTLIGSTLNIPTYTLNGLGGASATTTLTINGTTYDLSANRTWSVGTVTSVGLSTTTSGVTIGSTPVTGSGTITVDIATASGSSNGLLSSTDWTTFNSKQGALTLTTTGSSGAATLVGNTLNIPNYAPDLSGYVTLTTAQTITGYKTFQSSSTYVDIAQFGATTNSRYLYVYADPSGTGIANGSLFAGESIYFSSLSNYIDFSVNSTSVARIVNGGRLLLGTTTDNGIDRLQVTGTAKISSSITANSFVKTGGTSSQYLMADGSTSTLTNPVTGTGTTNYVARWTSSSAIGTGVLYDNGTNVGVGTTSPYSKLDIVQGTAGYGGWKYGLSLNATDYPALRLLATTGDTGSIIAHELGSTVFLTGTTSTTAGAERMRITSGGNVGIGTTSPINISGFTALEVKGTTAGAVCVSSGSGTAFGRIYNDGSKVIVGASSSHPLILDTNDTERMRITSGGEVCVNRTSGDGKFNVDGAVYLYNFSAGAGQYAVKYNAGTGLLSFDNSSIRYKDNVRDSIYGLSDIMKLKSVMFEYKQEKRTDIGLIAEDVYNVIPELVALDSENKPDSVSYDRFISVLIKSIQELKAEIEELKNK